MLNVVSVLAGLESELVVHAFAHAAGPYVNEADAGIRRMWARCRTELSMSEAIEPTGLPADLPETFDGGTSGSALIAAQQSADARFQAVLRREHDVINLSVLLGSSAERGWRELDHRLDAVLGNDTDILVGFDRLFLGKADSSHEVSDRELVHELSTLLPVTETDDRWADGERAGNFLIWEASPRVDTRTERRFAILTTPEHDVKLGDWVWAPSGGPSMPALARYCMHIAKIRYELRVRSNYPPTSELCARVDGVGGEEARQELVSLARTIGALRAMHRTVEIALSNAAAALRASGVVPAGGPFEDDRDLAAWFSKLLDDDIAYLDASFEAARRAVDAAGDALRSPTLTRGLDVAPTFGIITAMPVELAAMRALLDDPRREPVPGDRAHYAVGSLPSASTDRPHQVVLTMLADTGTNAASEACANLARSFDAVSCVIMSGVAAGVPDPARPKRHVRLGDVVVSSWGVVDYDHVVDLPAGRSLRQQHPLPSPLLSRCVKALEAEEFIANGEAERGWERWITAGQSALVGYARPDDRTGRLFATDGAKRAVPHPRRRLSGHRPGRPKVHQGRIGSGDRSLRNVVSRDELAAEHDLIAFEMEATGVAKAGFSNGLEWIVVRSISDYGDMRTNDIWRPYAALVAAAYVRALLAMCEPIGVRGGLTGA